MKAICKACRLPINSTTRGTWYFAGTYPKGEYEEWNRWYRNVHTTTNNGTGGHEPWNPLEELMTNGDM